MNLRLKLFFGSAAMVAAGIAAHAAALQITAISAGVTTAAPGDNVTYTVTVSNTAPTGNDYAGGTGNVTLSLTSNTASTINLGTVNNVTIPAITAGGVGTLQVNRTIPLSTSQAASYFINAAITGVGSFITPAAGITVTGKPDLKITSLSYTASSSYEGGNIIPMTLTWTNTVSTNGVNNVPFVPSTNGNAAFFRIEVILSSNPTFGDSDDFLLTAHDIATTENADGATRTISWNQLLPGNFAGTYYVMAKIDALSGVSEVIDNDLTLNGNNTWFSPDTNGTRITLLPTNFPTIYWASTNGNGYSDNPSISADGRYTAFASDSTNLGTGDTNGARDIFIYDNQTSTVRRLNLSQQGAQANAGSSNPAISAAGGYVAFASDATNLVLGDTNGFSDIFVVNTLTGAITRDSVSTAGAQADGSNFKPSISSDGRYLVFESSATNLVTGGTAVGTRHIYLRDRTLNLTTLVSQSSGGTAGNGNSLEAAISADGHYVVFSSDATNLVAGDTNGARDIFLRDLVANTTVRVSVATGGTEANGSSHAPSISEDGAYIAYGSLATNLVAGDTNGVSDIFVYNRVAATTVRVSVTSSGGQASDPSAVGFQLGSINPSISATGRYVTFASLANNLTNGDAGGQAAAQDANGAVDVFVIDRDVSASGTFDTASNIAVTMVSKNRFGFQTEELLGIPSTAASDIYPVISADGRWVALPSDAENTAGLVHGATNRTSPDTNTFRDVFLHDRRINAVPNPSSLPTVNITSPGGNPVLVNTAVPVSASATTTTGVVSTVQFFVNGTSIGTSSNFPYTQTWTPSAVGTYTLSAVVIDSFGNQGVSPNVTVTVIAAPSVGITTPGSGTNIVLGATQSVTATASAATPGATIASVQLLANGVSLGTVTTAPYTVSWTPTAVGNYSLTAVALDSNGTATTSAVVPVTVSSTSGPSTGPGVVLTSPAAGSAYTVGNTVNLTAAASIATGVVTTIDFFANGQAVGSASVPPFTVSFVPSAAGNYSLTAVATDNAGGKTTSSAVTISVSAVSSPTVAISSPADGTTFQVNLAQPITATVLPSAGQAPITTVTFFANNIAVGSASGFPFQINWKPVALGTYSFTAVATDALGNTGTSAPVTFIVSGGSPPSVSITTPSTSVTVGAGVPVNFRATATDSDGSISSVQFLANGIPFSTATTAPYAAVFTPTAGGSYSIVARATDNSGNVTLSTPVVVTVGSNALPVVSITSPRLGTTVAVSSPIIISASATDSDGTIKSVEFYANGVSIGADTVPPYSVNWAPTAEGYYTLTAVATDNSNGAVSSDGVLVFTALASSGSVDSVASGLYVNFNTAESGEFTIINVQGRTATLIADVPTSQTGATARSYFIDQIPIDSAGKFELTDSSGNVLVTGQFTAAGASGKFMDGSNTISFAGQNSVAAQNAPAMGYYTGSLTGQSDSLFVGIVGLDGHIAIYARSGSFADAGSGAISATGDFNFATQAKSRFTGKADPVTGFLSGTLTRADKTTDTFTAAAASGSSFSDGSLRNISTRGQVGSGDNILIAGFVIGGSSPKQVLLRAIGPTLASKGVTGVLANPTLTLYNGSGVQIGFNDDWGTAGPSIASTAAQVGAFSLAPGTLDSAILTTLNPGIYTAIVGGAGGSTGVGLIELYDANSVPAFSSEKMVNISTRGQVGTGDNILIAGFVVNGNAPKKVLIRGVGPGLASVLGSSSLLSDPFLRLSRLTGATFAPVRENDNWDIGNDATLVRTATARIGASPPLAAGSKDAALLLTLPPGIYSAQLSGVNNATGVGLLEVYEVQ